MRAWLALLLVACTSGDPAREAITQAPELEVVHVVSRAPEGGDEPDHLRVAFLLPDGSHRPVAPLAIAFAPRWRGGAALIDPSRRLFEVRADGTQRLISEDASALAAQRERLAYVTERDGLYQIRVVHGPDEVVFASNLAAAGMLRWDARGERLAFVGGGPSSVAGVWIASERGARCLSNCDLRIGEDWLDEYEALPAGAEAIEIGAIVRWRDEGGEMHEAQP